jgi:hypothetical protein
MIKETIANNHTYNERQQEQEQETINDKSGQIDNSNNYSNNSNSNNFNNYKPRQ